MHAIFHSLFSINPENLYQSGGGLLVIGRSLESSIASLRRKADFAVFGGKHLI